MSPIPQDRAGNYIHGFSVLSHIGQSTPENPQESPLTLQGLVMVDTGGPTSTTQTRSQVPGFTVPNTFNASGNLTFFSSSNPHGISRRNTYQGTTISKGATLVTCESVCVAGAVVAAIVVFCLSFCLFLCVGPGCRRRMDQWIANYYGGQRRTNPPVVATPTRLEPGRSRVSTTSIELPPLPPYPGNHLPPYSLNDSDASANVANPSSEIDHESSDVTPTREFSITPEDANSEVTSPNTIIRNDNESPVPPTPLISTIPLPPLSTNDHILRCDSSSDSENDNLHQCCSVNQPVNSDHSSDSDFSLEANGSLGLIFK